MEENGDTSPIPVQNRVKGIVHVPAERGEEGIEELRAELLFFVVAGEEDLAVLVEAVNQPSDGVGRGRAHCGLGYSANARSQADPHEMRDASLQSWSYLPMGGDFADWTDRVA